MVGDPPFAMRNLILEWEKPDSPLQSKLKLNDLLPVDKMKLTHATAIMSVASDLENCKDEPTVVLGKTLRHLSYFYKSFHDNTASLSDRYSSFNLLLIDQVN